MTSDFRNRVEGAAMYDVIVVGAGAGDTVVTGCGTTVAAVVVAARDGVTASTATTAAVGTASRVRRWMVWRVLVMDRTFHPPAW